MMSMAKMELEPSLPTTVPLLLLEELRKWMSTTTTLEPSERITALLRHRVHRVFAVVEPSAKLGIGEYFVRFVEQRHLRF